jgi:hypothetical protein
MRMAPVTRTLKKGGDTGKLDRAEVRAVTAAISAGRTADVLSGAVLQQFRAARKHKSVTRHETLQDLGIESVTHTITLERSAGTPLNSGGKATSVSRADQGDIVTLHAESGATREKRKASPRRNK